MNTPVLLASLMFAIASLSLSDAASAQPETDFGKANQLYADGHFDQSIKLYQTVVDSGKFNAALFYNIGNAYFRSGDFGRAILSYERALMLEPRHPEALANLGVAREEGRALELKSGAPEQLGRFFTVGQAAVAAAIAFWLSAFSFTAVLFLRIQALPVRIAAVAAILIFGLAVSALFQIERANRSLAVVTGTGTNARLATADTANTVLALPAGSEIRTLSRRGEWIYAQLPNNLRGWIPAKNVESVRL